MAWVKRSVSVRDKSEQNPLQPTPKNLAEGEENFTHYCMVCT
jgi:hypothetical protein